MESEPVAAGPAAPSKTCKLWMECSSEARFGRYVSIVTSPVSEETQCVCLQTGEDMSQETEILFGKQGEELEK